MSEHITYCYNTDKIPNNHNNDELCQSFREYQPFMKPIILDYYTNPSTNFTSILIEFIVDNEVIECYKNACTTKCIAKLTDSQFCYVRDCYKPIKSRW